jgi:hypothetical protein
MTTRRKCALGLAVFGVMIYVAAVGWHYHLRRLTEQHKAILLKQGEYLSLSQPWAKPLRGDRDKAIAFFQALTELSRGSVLSTNHIRVMHPLGFGRAMVAWAQPEIRGASGRTNSWEELAEELKINGPALETVRTALDGPGFDFNLYYAAGFGTRLPHLAKAKQAAQIFSMAATLALHKKDLDAAQTNLLTLLSLSKALHQDRFIISELVQISIAHIAAVTTWEALQASGWSDEQLKELQQAWVSLDFLEPIQNSFIFERGVALDNLTEFRSSPHKLLDFMGMPGGGGAGSRGDVMEQVFGGTLRAGLLGIWNSYWSYEDELGFLQITQVQLEALRQTNCSWKTASARIERELKALRIEVEDDSGDDLFPSLREQNIRALFTKAALSRKNSLRKALGAQTAKEMVTTAIALKRHQMRHGSYPASLEALVPSFLSRLPIDFMDGQTLRYGAESNGAYKLYSVGADGIDGGAKPPEQPPTNTRGWMAEHDWVWPRPATPAEVEEYEAREARKYARPARKPRQPEHAGTTNIAK